MGCNNEGHSQPKKLVEGLCYRNKKLNEGWQELTGNRKRDAYEHGLFKPQGVHAFGAERRISRSCTRALWCVSQSGAFGTPDALAEAADVSGVASCFLDSCHSVEPPERGFSKNTQE